MSKTIAYETAAGPQQVDAAHPLPVNATVTATASTVGKATAAAPTYSEGDVAAPLSLDLSGGLRVSGTINATSAAKATTAAPSYTNNTDNSFSQNLTGDLRVIAKQSGTWTVGLSAGSALVGSVSIDQTTNGVTNAVDVLNMPLTLDVNSGVKSNSTIRVTLATDQVQLTNALKVDPSAVTSPVSIATAPVLVAGSAIIGKVGIDQTTPGTTNLVAAGQSGTWNIGTVTTITGITTAFGAIASAVPVNAGLAGLRGATANPAAVTDGQLVASMADKLGRQVVVIGGPRDTKGDATITLTASTSETTLIAAVASTFLDLYGLIIENTSATVTEVVFRDTTGGSARFSFEVPPNDTRGFMLPSSDAFKQATVNTNWTAQCGTSVSSVKITALFVKNI